MSLPEDVKGLLENGVHFGHLSKHWNPKMKGFIFGKKKNIYIIDLEKTAQKVQEAKDFVKELAQSRKKILFVATKKQLRSVIKELAQNCGMPYVVERWVGGLLTNFSTVRKRVNKYIELMEKRDNGGFEAMVKKEVVRINREIERMERSYSGVVSLDTLPDCVFIVDTKKELACVREANKLKIPIVALIDTDADPEVVDCPIPGNDDSIKSVKYIASHLVEAINEGLIKADDIEKTRKKEEVSKNMDIQVQSDSDQQTKDEPQAPEA
ncbi:MAG: 30S ribosomal protein S2 [Candidatus Omnitrophica bacterium]|nr:30S ribosomal protein S2 [Candidatus Omnitrophota bacterium]